MKNKAFIASNQRVDGPDIKNIVNFNDEEFNLLVKHLISENGSVVIKGFNFSVSSGLLIECLQEDLSCITPNGEFAFYSQTDPQLTLAMANNATNYVEVQIFKETTEQQVKAFWDPNAGVDGEEFTQTVPTVETTSMRLVVNQVAFSGDNDKIPVAVVVTNGGVVERIHDNYKNQVLSGSPTNPTFSENLLFRLNDVNNNGFQDNYNFGAPRTDTTITSLEDSLAGIMTQIKDMIGDGRTTAEVSRNNWFDERPTNLHAVNQDKNLQLSGGGQIEFSTGTNQLSFDSDLIFSIPGIAGKTVIPTSESPITLNNDQMAYITLDRDAGVDQNVTVTVANNNLIPTDKDTIVLCRREDDRIYMFNGTSVGDQEATRIGRSIDANQLVPIGTIIPFYDFNGSVNFNTNYWQYCDGGVISNADSPLNGETTPDLSGRYLVGFGTDGGGDIDSAAWSTAPVGNSDHQIDLSHTHSGGTLQFQYSEWHESTGTSTNGMEINFYDQNGDQYVKIARQNWSFAAGGVQTAGFANGDDVNWTGTIGSQDATLWTKQGDTVGVSGSSLSSTTSIQPSSVRVRYIIRIR